MELHAQRGLSISGEGAFELLPKASTSFPSTPAGCLLAWPVGQVVASASLVLHLHGMQCSEEGNYKSGRMWKRMALHGTSAREVVQTAVPHMLSFCWRDAGSRSL